MKSIKKKAGIFNFALQYQECKRSVLQQNKKHNMSGRVYIGNLSNKSHERDVKKFFRGYGRIIDIMLKENFGFVEFESVEDAERAIENLNGSEVSGRTITVNIAKEKTGGGGGGGRRGGRDFRGGGGGRGGYRRD